MFAQKVIVSGIVRNGVVVPESNALLPEGVRVDVVFPAALPEMTPELAAELEMWDRASAEALELVERLAQEDEMDAQR
ncbi:hypothetical protein HYR99_02315 [Candidatus Poribacteria bacterium]|nr:hypothetical protein [Candidatus Poribacteria bacterium]